MRARHRAEQGITPYSGRCAPDADGSSTSRGAQLLPWQLAAAGGGGAAGAPVSAAAWMTAAGPWHLTRTCPPHITPWAPWPIGPMAGPDFVGAP